jgi:hypothetical protein
MTTMMNNNNNNNNNNNMSSNMNNKVYNIKFYYNYYQILETQLLKYQSKIIDCININDINESMSIMSQKLLLLSESELKSLSLSQSQSPLPFSWWVVTLRDLYGFNSITDFTTHLIEYTMLKNRAASRSNSSSNSSNSNSSSSSSNINSKHQNQQQQQQQYVYPQSAAAAAAAKTSTTTTTTTNHYSNILQEQYLRTLHTCPSPTSLYGGRISSSGSSGSSSSSSSSSSGSSSSDEKQQSITRFNSPLKYFFVIGLEGMLFTVYIGIPLPPTSLFYFTLLYFTFYYNIILYFLLVPPSYTHIPPVPPIRFS